MAFCQAMEPSSRYLTTTIRSSPSVPTVATLIIMSSAGLVPPKLTPETVVIISSTTRAPTLSTMLVNVGTPSTKLTVQLKSPPTDISVLVLFVQLTLLTGYVYNVAAASVTPN